MAQSPMTSGNFTWESSCGLSLLAAQKMSGLLTNMKISAIEELGHGTPFTWECVLPSTQPLNQAIMRKAALPAPLELHINQ
jgi:hypothetical protein